MARNSGIQFGAIFFVLEYHPAGINFPIVPPPGARFGFAFRRGRIT